MILIFGGTTEGRKSVAVCDEAAKPYYYSTKGEMQKIDSAHGIHITGALDRLAMRSFCIEKGIKLIINAAHPFAEALHRNITIVSEELTIPVVRYERAYPPRSKELLWFNSYHEAVQYLNDNHIDNLLALTGVNTIAKLKPYWEVHNCLFRILDREESRAIAYREGFPVSKILYYQPDDSDEISLFKELRPEAIITKESGESGKFNEKITAAQALGIPILVVKRPLLSSSFIPIYGENGLHKQIEQLLPDFFALKRGYTTGTCATAATKAALIALLTREAQTTVDVSLPSGELVNLPIYSTLFEADRVWCSVVKDAGDDPDITNGQEIVSTVQLNPNHKEIRFLQGEGVGVVTLPGLGLTIGEPAINATPRKMIIREILDTLYRFQEEVAGQYSDIGVDVTLSVPNGEEIARKTFNPKLGILGGISIIGTSGIVKPFSSDAFIASIRREMEVAKALGCAHIVINSGAKSEQFIKQQYPHFLPQAFIHYGNFIGESIKMASELGFGKLTLGIMIGKAVKLAEGKLDTHSKKVVMNREFLTDMARSSNCSQQILTAVQTITMARQLWEIIPKENSSFFSLILKKCDDTCKPLFESGELEIWLINENGTVIKG